MAVAVAVAAEGAEGAVVVAAVAEPDREAVPEPAARGQGVVRGQGVERGPEAVLDPVAAARRVHRDPAQVLDRWEALAPRGRAPAGRRRDRAVPVAAWLAGQGSAPAAA